MNLANYPWVKVAEHAVFVGIGAGLTWFTTYASGINFGAFAPLVVMGFSVATAFVGKMITATDPGTN